MPATPSYPPRVATPKEVSISTNGLGSEDNPIYANNPATQVYQDINATTVSASGDTSIVTAPGAGNRLVIVDFKIQNESTTTTLVILKAGSTAKRRGRLAENAALTLGFEEGSEWRLPENTALVVNLDGANQHGYDGRYFVEAMS